MNNISNTFGKLFVSVLALAGTGMSCVSCSDFLATEPLNEVVEVNYWDRKADVESVVYGCYSGFQTKDCMQRMFVWGELRSENITYTGSTDVQLKQLIGENILESSPWLNWKDFYAIINRCNTVIDRAPGVQELDPNYTYAEMKAHIAEVTWLRTLAYFYLVRTFRDIPYSDKPSKNDKNIEEDYCLAATPFKDLLRQLSSDLEAVKDDALKLYPLEAIGKSSNGYHASDNYPNTSRVTKCAFYALLADLYLWQGEYAKCVENCRKVLEYKMDLYEEWQEESDSYVSGLDLYFDKYPLYVENPSGKTMGSAYQRIFEDGNSFESIFEFYFERDLSPKNEMISEFFGDSKNSGKLAAFYGIRQGVYEGNNELFGQDDCRAAEYIENDETDFPILKFLTTNLSVVPSSTKGKEPSVSYSTLSENYSNWIIYRLTDVMLMQAEALIELDGEENLKEAFELISAVYDRGNGYKVTDANCLQYADYNNQAKMRELVQKERNRELMFEGKRWFDLVRYTLREPNNDKLISAVIGKQKEKPTAVRIQLKSRDALFWPYSKSELDVNKKLRQNEAYITNETSEK